MKILYEQPVLSHTKLLLRTLVMFVALASMVYAVPVHAQGFLGGLFGGGGTQRVHVVQDTSDTGRRNLVANEVTRNLTNEIERIQNQLEFKELTLDGIAWSLVQNVSQQMTSSIVNWINSGFQGSPAFVTNLDKFLLNAADSVAGEFIYGTDLDFLCEPIEFQVRVALEIQYRQADRDIYEPQCTLTDIVDNIDDFLAGNFSRGGWPAFFELTVGANNDPNKAYFNSYAELQQRINAKQEEEKAYLDYGNGVFSMKVCTTINDSNGQPRQDCDITTPGKVIENTLSYIVGENGAQALLQADEFNEIVSALLGQLANQALSGSNGLLGLGGNSRYSSNTFGSSGNQSYITALANDRVSAQQNLRNSNLDDALQAEIEYGNLQQDILDLIGDVEDQLADASTQSACFNLDLNNDLQGVKDDALSNLAVSQSVESSLQSLVNAYNSASTAAAKQEILLLFQDIQDQGNLRTASENAQLKSTFIDYELPILIEIFELAIEDEKDRCNI